MDAPLGALIISAAPALGLCGYPPGMIPVLLEEDGLGSMIQYRPESTTKLTVPLPIGASSSAIIFSY